MSEKNTIKKKPQGQGGWRDLWTLEQILQYHRPIGKIRNSKSKISMSKSNSEMELKIATVQLELTADTTKYILQERFWRIQMIWRTTYYKSAIKLSTEPKRLGMIENIDNRCAIIDVGFTYISMSWICNNLFLVRLRPISSTLFDVVIALVYVNIDLVLHQHQQFND